MANAKDFGKIILNIILVVFIIGAGYTAMKRLSRMRQSPKEELKENPGILVEVMPVKKVDHTVVVRATGTVRARMEINIIPQVSGKITYLAPNFVEGGFFKKDELLFKIEDIDYRLAIDRTKAALAKAEYDLANVESKARIARSEWKRLELGKKAKPNPLVLYEPQLKNAHANVDSARAALKQALLDLSRTKIKAPFNLRIRSENIELGQYVRAGINVAVAAGTDVAEVLIPLPLRELEWLNIPHYNTEGNGSTALIEVNAGKKNFHWKGRVVRSLGEIDRQSRMARIIAQVNDPYRLKKDAPKKGPNLEAATFVNVKLKGKTLRGVIIIPAKALRDNSTVWTMDSENKLRIKPVTVVRREGDRFFIKDSIKKGEKIVLTTLTGAADGMKLRIKNEGP